MEELLYIIHEVFLLELHGQENTNTLVISLWNINRIYRVHYSCYLWFFTSIFVDSSKTVIGNLFKDNNVHIDPFLNNLQN